MQNIEPLHDAMNYFYYAFAPIYFLLFAVILSTILSFFKKPFISFSIILGGLTLCALASFFIFLGVLADNAAPNLFPYDVQVLVMVAITFALCVLQAVRLIKHKTKT